MFKLRRFLWFTLFAGLLTGCTANPQAPARITGKVTYKANPVPAGMIFFHTDTMGIYSSPLKEDGTYEVHDVPKAQFTVTVETESVNPKKKVQDYGGKGAKDYAARMAAEGNSAANKAPPQTYVQIPSKYASAKTSGLSVTAEAGSQVHDITLTD